MMLNLGEPYVDEFTHVRVVSLSGWWFGTFFIFPYIGNNHPKWLSYFSDGWPNHQPAILAYFQQETEGQRPRTHYHLCGIATLGRRTTASVLCTRHDLVWAQELLWRQVELGRSCEEPGFSCTKYPHATVPYYKSLYMFIKKIIYIYIHTRQRHFNMWRAGQTARSWR